MTSSPTGASPSTSTGALPPHACSGADLAAQVETPPGGLSAAEAVARLSRDGPNSLPRAPPPSRLAVLGRQFTNGMVVLLAAAALLAAAIGETVDALVVAAIVLANAGLGYAQELRAESAAAAVRRLLEMRVRVLRDGRAHEIASEDVVRGDIVLLESGDRVPADGRLLGATILEADESSLTGESLPVPKRAEPPLAADTPLAERATMLHAATVVDRGTARLLVTATGTGTAFGEIAVAADRPAPRTPLQGRLDRLASMLLRAALLICAALVGVALAQGGSLGNSLLVGVSLAVAAVPEGLPAVVTVSLALGVRGMAERGAIVRRLHAVETLGCTTVICTDKTGTLTTNRLEVVRAYGSGVGELDVGAGGRALGDLLRAAALACQPAHGTDARPRDAVDAAIVRAQARLGDGDPAAGRRLLEARPFDADRRAMDVTYDEGGRRVTYLKGAPEALGGDAGGLRDVAEAWAADGARVLLVARGDDGVVTPLGLVGMADPPRDDAGESVRLARDAGVRTLMITGDHPATALAVARAVGIVEDPGARALTGAEIERLDPAELTARLREVQVVARVAPAQKVMVVEALQRAGEIVAMTGDGVNDVPALTAAHIGVAMGERGTDAAIGAADMVLTDDRYATIVEAIRRGRGIYDDILHFLAFLLAANAGELIVFAVAVGTGLGAPLGVAQILIVNLLTDGLPAVALGLDPPAPDVMRRPPRAVAESMLALGPLTVVAVATGGATLAAFAIGSGVDHAHGQTLAFATLVFAQLFYALSVRGDGWAWQAGPNLALGWGLASSAALGAACLGLAPLRELLDLRPLGGDQIAIALALAVVPFVAAESHKAWLRASGARRAR